jgi:hypothetical protein
MAPDRKTFTSVAFWGEHFPQERPDAIGVRALDFPQQTFEIGNLRAAIAFDLRDVCRTPVPFAARDDLLIGGVELG